MTNQEATKVAMYLRSGKRISAIKAIREATGEGLREAKRIVDCYLSAEDSRSVSHCLFAAERYLADNIVHTTTFEAWFRTGIDNGFFNLITEVKGV